MSTAVLVLAAALGAAVASPLLCRATKPSAANYQGVRLPVLLGVALALGTAAGALAFWATSDAHARGTGVRLALAATIVFLAGVVDDLVPAGPRGIRGHLYALASGHMTTGILKVLVTVGASVVAVTVLPRRSLPVELLGIVTMAGATNVWNGLDVAPGRAVKAFFLVVGGVVVSGLEVRTAPVIPAALAASAAVLPFDLRERGMLGDGGSNLLGFTAGLGLYLVLPGWAVGVAAAAIVALNVAADTVTLSRLIDAIPPLRWVDRLGRLRPGVGA